MRLDAEGFWSLIWSLFWILAFASYLFALFAVITDLFRDHKLKGGWKATWLVFLVFVPFLTVLVYVIARGPGMRQRADRETAQMQRATDDYIRRVTQAGSPSDEIAKAKALLDDGTIDATEFDLIKTQALSHARNITSPTASDDPTRSTI